MATGGKDSQDDTTSYVKQFCPKMGFFKGEKQKPLRLILTENALQCEQVSSKKTRTVKKSIMLVDVKVVEVLNSIVNAFQVACYDKDGWNMLYIICDNAGQRNDWIKLIRDASKKCEAHFLAKYHPDVYDGHKKKYKCCHGDRKSDGCQNTHSDESTCGVGVRYETVGGSVLSLTYDQSGVTGGWKW